MAFSEIKKKIKKCHLRGYRKGKRPKGEDLLTEDVLNGEVGGYVPTDEQMEGEYEKRD